jgi:CysZ protein
MIEGFQAAFGGMLFVVIKPRLWGYALVPALMLLMLGCVLTGFGIWGANWTTEALIGEPENIWGHMGGWLLTVALWLVAILLAILLALVLAQPLSGFALEAIVNAQERDLLGDEVPRSTFLAAMLTSTRVTALMLGLGGIAYGGLFVVDFFFPPALIVTAPVKFIVGAWLLAWNFLDYPLSLRGLGVIARVRWSVRHFEEFTVFGVIWATLLFVPGLFFLMLPMGVAGAARLVVATQREEMLAQEACTGTRS